MSCCWRFRDLDGLRSTAVDAGIFDVVLKGIYFERYKCLAIFIFVCSVFILDTALGARFNVE